MGCATQRHPTGSGGTRITTDALWIITLLTDRFYITYSSRGCSVLLQKLNATSAVDFVEFPTLDTFKPFEGFGHVRNTPTSGACGSARAHIPLPRCQLTVQRTFPRILEVSYRVPGAMCMVPLLASVDVKVNGVKGNCSRMMIVQGNAACEIFEPKANLFAIVNLPPSMSQRGWPAIADHSVGLFDVANTEALRSFKSTVGNLLSAASRQSCPLEPAILMQFEEALLSSLDVAMRSSVWQPFPSLSENFRLIVRRMDEYLHHHQTEVIYLEDVARFCGASIRTMQKATTAVRGMSASRYLRLRRLWSVRQSLASGRGIIKIADIARSHGFWHLSEFSASYRSVFDETPSDTLSRSRSIARPLRRKTIRPSS